MSDEKRLERIEKSVERTEKLVQDLIRIVGNTNTQLSQFRNEVNQRLDHLEKYSYRIEFLERRQDKTTLRLENMETHLELQSGRQNNSGN